MPGMMEPSKNLPFSRRLGFALKGLALAVASEKSLRIQIAAVPALMLLLAVQRVEAVWWAITSLACSTVLAAELFNTALERLCDHLHPERHPGIGAVKDCAAAAVLLACLGAVAVGTALVLHVYHRGIVLWAHTPAL